MKYCQYYWLIEPLKNEYHDVPNREPALSTNLNYEGKEYLFCVFSDSENKPEFARVTIRDLDSELIPDKLLPLLQILKEHLLSIMRLVYREDIQFTPLTVWSFFDAEKPYELNLLTEFNVDHVFDPNLVKNLFVHSMDMREDIRLLVDGLDARMPIQYRYLSFYKILEKKYKVNSHWKKKEFSDFLENYKTKFLSTGMDSSLVAVLHDLRDKCAHIKTGRKKQTFGVTHLNHKEAVRVEKLLPILREMCRDIINSSAQERFILGSLEPWYERIQSSHRKPSA